MKDKVEMNEMNPLKRLSSLSEDSNISEAIMSTLSIHINKFHPS